MERGFPLSCTYPVGDNLSYILLVRCPDLILLIPSPIFITFSLCRHKEHNCYVPELIFAHLLTGSNFDDNEKKTTGGRNGYGAKLANVFSNSFTIECLDSERKLHYTQVCTNNMDNIGKPTVKKITAAQAKKGDFVKITFSPDLQRFKMKSLDKDTVALLSKRAYDMAGTMGNSKGKKLNVWLNGKKLAVNSFKDYIGTFRDISKPVMFEKNDKWEVAVASSKDSSMVQVSFVNAICTYAGGTHVSYIADQVANHLQTALKKKSKGGTDLKPQQIKNHLSIYVNCLIENPTFGSQTKEQLTTTKRNFGSKFELSDAALKKIEKSDVSSTILNYASFKDRQALNRKSGKKAVKITGITKLDDANFAGSAKSKDCTLILTEGDSAKSLAVSGLSVVGRDYYGVFPLRGKPLNVRDANLTAVTKNEEISNLIKIMGLKFDQKYDSDESIKTLRYGHLMIMADQDVDGSHIKGLILNFIDYFWPSLLNRPGFLQQFITPIVKATKGKSSKTFFNLPEYNEWLESTGNQGKGWKIKYYKGLGTSTSAEAKEYFSHLDTHEINFAPIESDILGEEVQELLPKVDSSKDMVDMVFRKSRVEDRKEWLNNMPGDVYLNYSEIGEDGVHYSEFINKEYILFSRYDNERSIPHLIDGFKPSQRKVLFGCFKRKLKSDVKVAQLCGYIAEHSAYHHGEASLQGTIIGMAQEFVGSNNINLLTPSGQFGTRRMGGKDAASPRYIFTKLEPITRLIYHPDDDDLLQYRTDDGQKIEPDYYVPVIPMVLVNGADGIGTGWSSSVCNYDARDIVANLRRRINREDFSSMKPYYYGWTGEIDRNGTKKGSFTADGRIERIDDTTLLITELPIKKWTQDYKVLLEKMMAKEKPEIKSFMENHTDTTVSFTVEGFKNLLDEWEADPKGGLMKKFSLSGSLTTTNMTLFSLDGRIAKFEEPTDIMETFYGVRLEFYDKRKALLEEKLQMEQRKLSNKARFVQEVCDGVLVVAKRKKSELLKELVERGYEQFAVAKNKDTDADADSDNEEAGAMDLSDAELSKGYDYLISMPILSLTYEKVAKLKQELSEKTQELEILQGKTPSDLWLQDLDAIEVALDERDQYFKTAQEEESLAQNKNAKRRANKGKTAKKAPIRKPAAVRKPAATQKTKDDDMDIASVAQSITSSLHVSPQPKQRGPAKRAGSPELDPAPTKKAPPKTRVPAKAPAIKKAPVKKKTILLDSDSELDEMSFDSDSEQEEVVQVAPRARGQRARKQVVYDIDSSDSDVSESDFE